LLLLLDHVLSLTPHCGTGDTVTRCSDECQGHCQINELADLQRRMVMPVLAWIAFWSLLMGVASCWGGRPRPVRLRAYTNSAKKHRDHPAV
jgi:hypothetical protein